MKTKIETTFGIDKVLLPVIHVESEEQALRNVEVAGRAECRGVFLINHRMKHTKLFPIIDAVRLAYPNLWIGVNTLDLSSEDSIRKCPQHINGIWTDDPQITENVYDTTPNVNYELIRQRKNCIYFGGVAFKYQNQPTDIKSFTKLASNYMDVVTTSGDATGESAYIGKIMAMKSAIGKLPLGIASGITPINVESYLPYVDAFLVASGISDSFTELSFEKTKTLNNNITKYKQK